MEFDLGIFSCVENQSVYRWKLVRRTWWFYGLVTPVGNFYLNIHPNRIRQMFSELLGRWYK